MPFNFGDVVLAPFPFTNQANFKKRPAVVVSSQAYNSARPDVIIMPITSQLRPSSAFGDVFITGWQKANLLKQSAIKPVFATIEQKLVLRRLGVLDPADQFTLRATIAILLR
jgi:mRNA interferase MazF